MVFTHGPFHVKLKKESKLTLCVFRFKFCVLVSHMEETNVAKYKPLGWLFFNIQSHSHHEIAIFRNPHNSSNWYSRITWQLVYKHLLSKSCIKKYTHTHIFSLYFRKNITCLINAGRLRICFSVCYNTVYRLATTNSCFMSDMVNSSSATHPNTVPPERFKVQTWSTDHFKVHFTRFKPVNDTVLITSKCVTRHISDYILTLISPFIPNPTSKTKISGRSSFYALQYAFQNRVGQTLTTFNTAVSTPQPTRLQTVNCVYTTQTAQ
jgi:hypothetical protein